MKIIWLPVANANLKPNTDYLIANTHSVHTATYICNDYFETYEMNLLSFADYPLYAEIPFNLPTAQEIPNETDENEEIG
jgi:hypothetical protein